MANFQPLNKNHHQTLKVMSDTSYAQSANSHIVPVSVFELPHIQAEYPVAFIKDSDTGRFHLVALLGLKPQENLFHKVDGWNARYVPQYLTNYPFMLSASPENPNDFVVGIDLDSARVSESEGEALFEDDGEQSKFLTQITDRLAYANSQVAATQGFIQAAVDKNLLTSQSLTITPKNGEEFSITGLYSINETAFRELNDIDFIEIKNKGFLTAIYSCLFSTQRISSLIDLTNG